MTYRDRLLVLVLVSMVVLSGCHDSCSSNGTSFPCDLIRNSSLRKCFCAYNEVWHDPKCISQRTRVPVVNFEPWAQELVRTDAFKDSHPRYLTCEGVDLLSPLQTGSFHLLPTGELIQIFTGVIYPVERYCVEHILDLDQKKVKLGGFVCIPPPTLPTCCRPNQFLDTVAYECRNATDLPLNPPIYNEPQVLRWESIQGVYTGLPVCYETEVYRQFDVDTAKHIVLLYRSNGVFLQWKNAPQETPYLVSPQDYCVVHEKRNHTFFHSAYFCDEPKNPPLVRKFTHESINPIQTPIQTETKQNITIVVPIVLILLGRF